MSKKGEQKEMQRRMKVLEQSRKKAMKKRTAAKSGKPGEKVGLIKRITNFLKDVRRELNKVSWPSRAETVSSTWVVVVVCFIFGAYFGVVDQIVGFLVNKLILN